MVWKRAWIVVFLAAMSCASTRIASPGEPAAPRPGLLPVEDRALADVLKSLNLSPEDLRFEKDQAAPRWALPAVRRLLDDPLSAPAFADAFRDAVSGRDPSSVLGALAARLDLDAAAPPLPDPPVPAGDDEDGWRALWAPLAPEGGYPSGSVEAVGALPEPVRRALALVAATLPLAAAQVEAAFAGLAGHDRDVLEQFGRIMTLARDESRPDYQPPDPERAAAVRAAMGDAPPLAAVLEAAERVDVTSLVRAGMLLAALADRVEAILAGAGELPGGLDLLRLETRLGALVVSGTWGTTHAEPVPFLIELGGDETYRGDGWGGTPGRPDRPLALLVDMAGDDAYFSGGPASLGGAFMGAAAFRDRAGGDVYRGADITQGAALFGAASFVDGGGEDDYRAGAFCQGAAAFGVALLRDVGPGPGAAPGAGNDRYLAGEFAQGFARTLGASALHDTGGHDSYRAGGRIPYLPLYRTRHFSLSQGFAIGVREHDAGGGVALLLDEAGDDRYAADVHGQGASCFFGVGVLYDTAGNDRYGLTFEGQGGAVHMAAGILVDGAGDDVYTLDDGLGQGTGHDLAVGFLAERGGNDRYVCRACAQGVGLTNGIGILLERGGNDVYAALEGHYQGAGRPRRNYGSVGLLVDAGGRDRYAEGPVGVPVGARRDGAQWTLGTFGAGVDLGEGLAEGAEGEGWQAKPVEPAAVELPEGYAFTAQRFRTLFDEASLWDVGVDRPRVARARGELVSWGARAVPHLKAELGKWGGLHLWALDSVVLGIAAEHRDAVRDLVLEALRGSDSTAMANALRLAGKLRLEEAAPVVLKLLADPNWRQYAMPAAGRLRLRAALPLLLEVLEGQHGGAETMAALRALSRIADPSALGAVLAWFGKGGFPVRSAAVEAAAGFGAPAVEALTALAGSADEPGPVRVHALQALGLVPDACKTEGLFAKARAWCADPDWAVRARAATLVASFPGSFGRKEVLAGVLKAEAHPYVRGVVRRELDVLEDRLPREPDLRSGIVEYPEYGED